MISNYGIFSVCHISCVGCKLCRRCFSNSSEVAEEWLTSLIFASMLASCIGVTVTTNVLWSSPANTHLWISPWGKRKRNIQAKGRLLSGCSISSIRQHAWQGNTAMSNRTDPSSTSQYSHCQVGGSYRHGIVPIVTAHSALASKLFFAEVWCLQLLELLLYKFVPLQIYWGVHTLGAHKS